MRHQPSALHLKHRGVHALKAIIRSRSADGGTVTFRASKTDQQGTVAAVQRYLDGPLFRRIRKGGQVTARSAGRADSARAIAHHSASMRPPAVASGYVERRGRALES